MARGYDPGLKSMQSIGYSHMAALIADTVDRAECLRTLKRDTRRFAKRQMTWSSSGPRDRVAGPGPGRRGPAAGRRVPGRGTLTGC